MSEFPFARLGAYQHRQELHDRYFHQDIYTLAKARRLQHLVLHHCKYMSKIHTTVSTNRDAMLDLGSAQTALESTATDGIIVALSMMNVCNVEASPKLHRFERGALSVVDAADRLIGIVGSMAKVIEDIDHMDADSPLQQLGQLAVDAMTAYMHIRQRDSANLHEMFMAIQSRLLMVERKNIFFATLHHEIRSLYPSIEF